MGTLRLFGATHLAILAAVPVVAAALAAAARARPSLARPLCRAIAAVIAVNELVWYRHGVSLGWLNPPHGLPLDLCDVVLWLAVYALATLRPWALEAVYFLGLAGSGMALVTPDLADVPFPSYAAIQFFLAHGAIVASVLFLVLAGLLRPRPGAWWRTLLGVNAYALAVGVVNARFGTNYMYLCERPRSGTLLDLLGPWPVYILGADAVAAVLLFLLSLPFRGGKGRRSRAPGELRLP
ncbi:MULTISPECIES: YwaF family protein [Anaeromyxobacter]|uniref:YwaF family protein n=1 Tax=Anaeromyxobacter TaxID=161492 RepID=UPI001F5ACC7E|nr:MULTISPECIES: TIGR02206 family membrane protein [unclassified Anaeromyxobacter]